MSGSLRVSDQGPVAWMPKLDVFCNILEEIVDQFHPKNDAFLSEIDQAIRGFPHLSISEKAIDIDTFSQFLRAVTSVFEKGHSQPNTLSPYELLCFAELKALLLSDPRAGGVGDKLGQIVAHDGTVLEIPRRFMDLFLEVLSVSGLGIRETQPKLAQRLLASRVSSGIGIFNLDMVSDEEFCDFLKSNRALYKFYEDGNGRISTSIPFFEAIAKTVREFSTLIKRDPRVSKCQD
jgi:hypothetical protein